MRRFRFSVAALSAITTDKPREFVHDDQVPALAMQITSSGAKSFYVVKKHAGGKIVQRIGALGEVSISRARAIAAEIITKLTCGNPYERQKRAPLYLHQVMNEYLAHAQDHRAPGTVISYNGQWRKHIGPWGDSRPLASLRRHEVTAFHQQIGKENGRMAANRVIALLRAAINRAIREHELDIPNPATAITFYRERSRSRRLEVEELAGFFKAVEEEPNRDVREFVLLALFTGARRSNLQAMRWQHVSLLKGLWVVPAEESKTGFELPVVLSSHVVAILRARKSVIKGPFVFPGRGTNDHMVEPKAGWRRICESAGLKDLHLHDLRRSLASFQIDTGTPLEVIQKTLGHESKVTTEIYARMALEPVRASLERAVDEMLKSETK
ncbi:MAG: tyrosine-type recombinase/integrase [bacterium]|nr:tyrosine-type recombinase/integrase [bacterium]